ncbi:MAG: flagellar assembly protein FliW [Bryobacteraceae bacterium]
MPSLDTKNFGRIAFEPQDTIEFPRGLPGFEDRETAGLASVRRPRIGKDVWALAVIAVRETGPTVNLLAPLVVNLRSLRAVQAVMRESAYSHRHALPQPAEVVCS